MNKENKTSDKHENGNDFIADVSGSPLFKKYEHIFKNNTYLLDEPEVKELLKLFDNQLKTSLYNILEYVNMSDVYLDTVEEREKAVKCFLNSDWFISVT